MRSFYSGQNPSALNILLLLLFSISPLVSSYKLPHIWKRDAGSTQANETSADDIGGFEDLGHLDTTSPSPPPPNEEPAFPSSAATTSSTASSPNPTNPTRHLTTLNTTSLGSDAVSSTCSSLESWYIPNLDLIQDAFIKDCYLAVQQLYLDDVHFNPLSNTRLEFVARPSSNGLPPGFKHTTTGDAYTQETPIMYEANTCTLAVVMLSSFVNLTGGTTESLPGNFKQVRRMRNTDMATFRGLHMGGRIVENDCLKRFGRGGWIAVGDDSDIGVFLYATNSTLDRALRPAIEEIHTGGVIGSGTGTSKSESESESESAPSTSLPASAAEQQQQQEGGGAGGGSPSSVLAGNVKSTQGGDAVAASSAAPTATTTTVMLPPPRIKPGQGQGRGKAKEKGGETGLGRRKRKT